VTGGIGIMGLRRWLRESITGQAVLAGTLLTFMATTITCCDGGGSGGGETPTGAHWDKVPTDAAMIISPARDAEYVGTVPPVLIALVDPLATADEGKLKVTLNGTDLADRLTFSGTSVGAAGFKDLLNEGNNVVSAELGGDSHSVSFTFSACAEPPCPEADAPVITGPEQATALRQTTLKGTDLGTAADSRVLYFNGQAMPIIGGHAGEDRIIFVPPVQMASVSVVVEVNGKKSAPFQVQLAPAPALERPAAEVINDFRGGLSDLADALDKAPSPETGDPVLDAMLVDLRVSLTASTNQLFAHFDNAVDKLPPEGQEILAQFIEQNSLDSSFSLWVERALGDEGKADLVTGRKALLLDTQCESYIVSLLTLVTLMTMLQDALTVLTLGCVVGMALVPAMAGVLPVLLECISTLAKAINILKLLLKTVLPDITALEIDLPEVVGRFESAPVHATGTFVYDPAKKMNDITDFAIGEMVSTGFDAFFAEAGISVSYFEPLAELVNASYEQALDVGKYLQENGTGTGPEGEKVPVEPTLIGFYAEYFKLSKGEALCEGKGSWKESAPCELEDEWDVGWRLTYSGFTDLIFGNFLNKGTVKTSESAEPLVYDDAGYGFWMEEAFGGFYGCDNIQKCYDTLLEYDECSPPAMAEILCNAMTLGYCPTQHDVDLAIIKCEDKGCGH